MAKVRITLPDESVREYEEGITGYEVARSIGEGLAKSALAISINDTIVDLSTKILKDSKIKILTLQSEEGLEIIRHSSAHLMAQAVSRIFSDAKYAIGPTIKDGFYYDFDLLHRFTPEDIEKIESEMQKIVSEDLPIERKVIKRKDAIEYFKKRNDIYKVEILEELTDAEVSLYSQGDFTDLCRGPHAPRTGLLKALIHK